MEVFIQGRKHNACNMQLSKYCHEMDKKSDDDSDVEEYPEEMEIQMPVRNENKIGRNAPCPCGSGKKYKRCCLKT